MFQKQMPAWVSHYLPDPCQAEDDRLSATCALEVRAQCWMHGGQELRAGDRLREARGIVENMEHLHWDSPHVAPGDVFRPSWGWGSRVGGPAVVPHGLDKMPWSGSRPSWGQASSKADITQLC